MRGCFLSLAADCFVSTRTRPERPPAGSASSSSSTIPRIFAGSTWMPGPIVLVERDLLDVAALRGGRLRAHDLVDDRRVVLDERRSSKLFLPIARWTFAPRSVRYSSLPAFASRTALPTSKVTVPVFGFGIRPRGPSTRPSRPTLPIWSGVAIATSKSVKPSSIRFARSAEPTTSAPASSASRALSPSAKTATRRLAAGAVRQHQRAAQLLVGVADVQAEAEVHLDGLVELRRPGSPSASGPPRTGEYVCSRSIRPRAST